MKTIPELLGFNAKHSERKSMVFEKELPKGVWGMIDMNGVIEINKNLNKKQKAEAVKHERMHLQQIKDGVLKFDSNNYYYKPNKSGPTKIIPNEKIDTRSRKLPWEASVEKAMRYHKTKKRKK